MKTGMLDGFGHHCLLDIYFGAEKGDEWMKETPPSDEEEEETEGEQEADEALIVGLCSGVKPPTKSVC